VREGWDALRAERAGVYASSATSATRLAPRRAGRRAADREAVRGRRGPRLALLVPRRRARIEAHLGGCGVPAVVPRPADFMTNLPLAAEAVAATGTLAAPAGGASIATIHPGDVAAAAAVAVTEAGREGEAAGDLSAATGGSVVFVDVPDAAPREGMLAHGMPEPIADFLVAMFRALREGLDARVTTAVRDLTGREPRPFAAVARSARPRSAPASGPFQGPDELLERRHLTPDEPLASPVERHPLRAVDLGEAARPARSPRPLHLELVARDPRRVEVALAGEDDDALAARLAELAQLEDGAVGGGPAELLLELPQRHRQGLLAGLDLALGDRPGARVPARPERAAHVGEEHLERSDGAAVQEQAGAAGRHPALSAARSRRSRG
jgi:hypothetical protein